MTKPRPDRVRVSGPLAPFADGYSMHLAEAGYLPASVQAHLQRLAQVSRWMEDEGLDVGGLSLGALERFLIARRYQGYVSSLSMRALHPLLGHLDRLGVLSATAPGTVREVDRLVEEFRDYLAQERGLVPGSVTLYARVARRFLGSGGRRSPMTWRVCRAPR